MKQRKRPPLWFKWMIWFGIATSVAIPAALLLDEHGAPITQE